MSAWTDYVTKFYNEKKKSNPDYKFKNALVDASKARKKGGDIDTTMNKSSSKKRSQKRKTMKRRR